MANFTITARSSDLEQWYKDRAAQQTNYNTWNDLVKAYTEQATSAYEQSSQALQQQASYDISDAYNQYRKQQMQLSLNQQLSAGAKEGIADQLSSAYESTAGQTQYNLASNLQELYDSYAKTVTGADATLSEQMGISDAAASAAKALPYLNKYISSSNEYQQLWNEFRKIYKSDEAADEALRSSLFSTSGEGADMTTGLSDTGKRVLASLIHRGISSGEDESRKSYNDFYDYLYNTNQSAYDFFAENPGLIDEMLGFSDLTDEGIQSSLTADDVNYYARKRWFDTYGEQLGVKQTRSDGGSKLGATIKFDTDAYAAMPTGSSFEGDINLSNVSNYNSLIPYGQMTRVGTKYLSSDGKDFYDTSHQKYHSTPVTMYRVSVPTSGSKSKETIERLKKLGAIIMTNPNQKNVYFYFPNNTISGVKLYKNNSGYQLYSQFKNEDKED